MSKKEPAQMTCGGWNEAWAIWASKRIPELEAMLKTVGAKADDYDTELRKLRPAALVKT